MWEERPTPMSFATLTVGANIPRYPLTGGTLRDVIMQRGITRAASTYVMLAGWTCSLSTVACIAAVGVGVWTAIPFLRDNNTLHVSQR